MENLPSKPLASEICRKKAISKAIRQKLQSREPASAIIGFLIDENEGINLTPMESSLLRRRKPLLKKIAVILMKIHPLRKFFRIECHRRAVFIEGISRGLNDR